MLTLRFQTPAMPQLLVSRRLSFLPRFRGGCFLSRIGVLSVEVVYEEGSRLQDRLVSSSVRLVLIELSWICYVFLAGLVFCRDLARRARTRIV